MSICQIEERDAGRSYPRTCPTCKLSGACAKGLDRESLKARIRELEGEQSTHAPVSVSEAARVLFGIVKHREWSHYPIEMPLTLDGKGPAKVGRDAHCMTYEVWKSDTFRAISDHNNLPDAIEAWLLALIEKDQTNE